MLGFTITKKSDLEAQAIKLSNAEAKAEANSKKFKTATIAGSATTGAAVAAIAAHFLFGNGRKVNRNKIKNFDSVVEERDAAVTARVAAETKVTSLETEKKGLQSTCELLAGSAYNIQAAASIATGGTIEENATFQRACYEHDLLVKKAFNPKDDEEFMKLRQGLFKSFTESIKELEKLDVAEETETEEETEEKVQQPQNNQIPQNNQQNQNDQTVAQNAQNAQNDQTVVQNQNDQTVAQNAQNAQNDQTVVQNQNDQTVAQNRYNDACAKAGAAKTAFENAEKKLAAAKASAPDGDHKDLEAAVNTAKAAFDAADKELVDAKSTLDALG